MKLEKTFNSLLSNYTSDNQKIDQFWNEIELRYSEEHRYYHTMTHLEDLLTELEEVKSDFDNYEAVLFALFYHDIVYDATNSNNEEDSAKIASERMSQLEIDAETKQLCYDIILATKSHEKLTNRNINLFTDADLSILGKEAHRYENYFSNVRKEYSVYSKFMYKRGRVKVLKSFLGQEQIFKTDYFRHKYESTAKTNILREIEFLRQNR